jgi:prepilin-type processing-associated H-X9-DG protein
MNTGKRFTKIDVLVTAICLVVLAVNLPVLSSSGKTHAKTDVCLANLMQLSAAWALYAEDNGGKLVNGAPTSGQTSDPRRQCDPATYPSCTGWGGCSGVSCNRKAFAPLVAADDPIFSPGGVPWHLKEKPWVGPAWRNLGSFYSNTPAPEDCQKCAIESGALWKYVRQYNIYKCPVGKKGELLSYSIMDGMNGEYMYRASGTNDAIVRALCYKTMGAIKKTSERVVFIDEGYATSDSFGCYYDRTLWYDFPPVRHGNGTTVSYADGHAEWWKYKGKQTVAFAKIWDSAGSVDAWYNPVTGTTVNGNVLSASCPSLNDLYKMQASCWGSVGYTNPMPSCQLSSD